jgi:predicted Rdx family selenoprotein
MVDPITALAAISSAVELVKKVAATVDDVTSLGPVLGKYFDAKADAIEVVQKSQEGGFKGSALGKALELEMAIEQAKQFEEQIKMLFFQANKMDVWVRIAARAQRMEADAAHAARRKKEAQKKHEQEMEELFVVVIGIVVVFVTVGTTVWFIMEATAQGTR